MRFPLRSVTLTVLLIKGKSASIITVSYRSKLAGRNIVSEIKGVSSCSRVYK